MATVGLGAVVDGDVFAESSTAVAAAVGGADALDGEGTSLAAAEAIVTAQANSKQKITLAVILVATSVCSAKFLEGYTSGACARVHLRALVDRREAGPHARLGVRRVSTVGRRRDLGRARAHGPVLLQQQRAPRRCVCPYPPRCQPSRVLLVRESGPSRSPSVLREAARSSRSGLIASASVIGILFGVMFAWTPFGRKRPLMGASLIAIVAASFMVWSPVVWVLIGARFVAGYGIGIAFVQGASCRHERFRGLGRSQEGFRGLGHSKESFCGLGHSQEGFRGLGHSHESFRGLADPASVAPRPDARPISDPPRPTPAAPIPVPIWFRPCLLSFNPGSVRSMPTQCRCSSPSAHLRRAAALW